MLKGVPSNISPELLKILMEMGHGDEVVIADGNFPSASHSQRLIRLDGQDSVEVLRAVLQLFPLDTYVDKPITLMAVAPGDPYEPVIWDEYQTTIAESGEPSGIEHIDRFAFYERTKNAYAVIATGESALYANLILKKGVVKE